MKISGPQQTASLSRALGIREQPNALCHPSFQDVIHKTLLSSAFLFFRIELFPDNSQKIGVPMGELWHDRCKPDCAEHAKPVPERSTHPRRRAFPHPWALPLRAQVRRRVRKARPFERLLRAPSAAHANLFLRQLALFELHVNAAASGIDSNAVLRGRNADYHTGLI